MSRKLSLIQKSFGTLLGVVLLGIAIMTMNGCTAISGKQVRAEKTARESNGKIAPELAGKWHKKQAGFAEYAKYAENLGYFESYEITEDGRVRRETLIAEKNYDCRTETSATSAGTITLASDSQMNISLDAGTIRQTGGCSADKNYTSSTLPSSTDYQFKLGRDASGAPELCLTQTNGEAACYRRAE